MSAGTNASVNRASDDVGHGDMIEAEMTGTRVHITPVRLGYGFAGLGRPRA